MCKVVVVVLWARGKVFGKVYVAVLVAVVVHC